MHSCCKGGVTLCGGRVLTQQGLRVPRVRPDPRLTVIVSMQLCALTAGKECEWLHRVASYQRRPSVTATLRTQRALSTLCKAAQDSRVSVQPGAGQ